MSLAKNSLFFTALLAIGTPLKANDKTLFVNGVNTAMHGDIVIDKGDWRDKQSYSALRIKAGFQLIRIGFVGLTLAYQKVGFYTAEKNWTQAGASRTRFDYHGPLGELHLFPSALFGFSIAGFQGAGYSFTQGDNSADFPALNCEGETTCLATTMERSRLSVREFTAQVNYTVRPGTQVFVGVGSRHVSGTPAYLVSFPGPGSETQDAWESYNAPKWKLDTQFYLLGLRGTTL